MRLKRLKLNNFRRFRDFEIDFHEQLTVIVARNGLGKTSVLDAITLVIILNMCNPKALIPHVLLTIKTLLPAHCIVMISEK